MIAEDRVAGAFVLLDGYVTDDVLPGAAAIVGYQGRIIGEHYTGLADAVARHPITADTLFAVASLTKPLTATALMALVERGLCSLDEPVGQIAPEFAALSRGVTVRHLLTHTSGLPGFAPRNEALRAAQAPLPTLLEAFLRCSPGYAPGTAFRYSNAGVAAQAALIARLSGVGYHEAVAALALRPLGMHDSFLPVARAHWSRIAQVADAAYAGLPHESFNSPYFRSLGLPWGGLYATARDIHRFLTYFLAAWPADDDQAETATEREGPLSPATRRAMTVAQVAVPPASPHPDDDLDARAWPLVEWGLGWEIKGAKRPHRTGELTSPRTFTHAGAAGALMWADPASGLSCVLLTNRALASGWATVPARHARFSNAVAAAVR